MKTLLQCDFDGSITIKDASFFLLDEYASGDWRSLFQDYKEGRISVGEFNTRAFAMVKADEATLTRTLQGKVQVRRGFPRMVSYCKERGFRLVIVSNGLEFYIREVLKKFGLDNLEIHAAKTEFHPDGLRVQYLGPEGEPLDIGLKETYIKMYLRQGYRVLYVGNGDSDVAAAALAYKTFATGDLLKYFQENNIPCEPFEDLSDIIEAMKLL
ncbi:MAG: HAD-IB family phosphatase [Dehalococcoidia bacterium]|nr:HAD-IB family phosphatase [Dehalococcoidia bacterium]